MSSVSIINWHNTSKLTKPNYLHIKVCSTRLPIIIQHRLYPDNVLISRNINTRHLMAYIYIYIIYAKYQFIFVLFYSIIWKFEVPPNFVRSVAISNNYWPIFLQINFAQKKGKVKIMKTEVSMKKMGCKLKYSVGGGVFSGGSRETKMASPS